MLNCVTLMGRLVADPELRTTTTGKSVATFRIAVDRSFVRQGEQRQADFIPIVAWENTANFVCRYFAKGSMIAVQGQLQSRSYEDSNGAKRTAYEVLAREVSFCGSKAESGTSATPAAHVAPAVAPSYQTATANDFEEITDDEDLPF
ncbi:MAG: single-stranded DNA-binding protein [Ruminococcaceae bacterium]|nr:single-stranded DNA-binding protein [Oscillospiraceae bacterium]